MLSPVVRFYPRFTAQNLPMNLFHRWCQIPLWFQGQGSPISASPLCLLLSAIEPPHHTSLMLQGSVKRHKKGKLNSTLSILFLVHKFNEIEMKEEILANMRFGKCLYSSSSLPSWQTDSSVLWICIRCRSTGKYILAWERWKDLLLYL